MNTEPWEDIIAYFLIWTSYFSNKKEDLTAMVRPSLYVFSDFQAKFLCQCGQLAGICDSGEQLANPAQRV